MNFFALSAHLSPASLVSRQFELAREVKESESEPKPPKKKRARVIQDDDDDEAEWNQDELEDSGGDDGSAYEVTNKQCTCCLHRRTWYPHVDVSWMFLSPGSTAVEIHVLSLFYATSIVMYKMQLLHDQCQRDSIANPVGICVLFKAALLLLPRTSVVQSAPCCSKVLDNGACSSCLCTSPQQKG